jgi:hypothetical protein
VFRFKYLFIILSFAVGSFAFPSMEKNECGPVDLRTSSCLPQAKNQSDTDWCYAYAAADMVSYHFCQEVSPAALGLLTSEANRKPGEFWIRGGWQDETIKLGNEHGFCLEKDLPSQLIINEQTMGLGRAYLTLLKAEQSLSAKSDCEKTEDKADKRPFHLLGKVSRGRLGPNLTLLRQGALMLQGSETTTGSV